eukprot:jgi/Mesen1/8713/ME000052S08137
MCSTSCLCLLARCPSAAISACITSSSGVALPPCVSPLLTAGCGCILFGGGNASVRGASKCTSPLENKEGEEEEEDNKQQQQQEEEEATCLQTKNGKEQAGGRARERLWREQEKSEETEEEELLQQANGVRPPLNPGLHACLEEAQRLGTVHGMGTLLLTRADSHHATAAAASLHGARPGFWAHSRCCCSAS